MKLHATQQRASSHVHAHRSFRSSNAARILVTRSAVEQGASATTKPAPLALPANASQQTFQAAAAITAAFKDGICRQHVQLLLPLIGATDLDDWPGGIRQQFKAAQPLVESILRTVKQAEGLQGPLAAEIWDQGDAVAAWTSPNLAAVLFPTAATMDKLKALAKKYKDNNKLLIIINPQWETKGLMFGQSDFGFGPWRQESEALVASLQPSYQLKSQRIYGDDVRLLKAHPGEWQVYAVDRKGSAELLASQEEQPPYQQIEDMLRARPSSRMNMSIMDRLKDEYQFNQDSLKR